MTIGEIIKKYKREHNNLSQRAFSKQCDLTNGIISMYESGINPKTQKPITPQLPTLNKLAKGMGISIDTLFEMADDLPISLLHNSNKPFLTANESHLLNHYRALDFHGRRVVDLVLDEEYERCTAPDEEKQLTIQIKHSNYKVSAGTGFDLSEDDDWGDTIDVPDTTEARKADFALTIQGRSMEPVYFNGDIILVKKQDDIDFGQIGIFRVNGSGYIKKKGEGRLISLNDEYPDILVGEYDEYGCVGKVIGRV